MTPFRAGLIAIVLILVGAYLGFTKDIPFTRPFELKAVFQNAPPIGSNTAVRIAGVDVGKVSKVEPLGGDSPGVRVTMKFEDEGLPIHKDAQVELRERIFLEGNLFLNVKPGTPDAPELEDGDTIPVSAPPPVPRSAPPSRCGRRRGGPAPPCR
jgi:ABC-type transporter Mla subunit MlaD